MYLSFPPFLLSAPTLRGSVERGRFWRVFTGNRGSHYAAKIVAVSGLFWTDWGGRPAFRPNQTPINSQKAERGR
jgi:hypothetical protein